MMKALLAGLVGGFLLLVGCRAYHLGAPGANEPTGLYIAPVVNRTSVPQVRSLLTQQLRRTFGQSAQWRLVDDEAANLRLVVELTNERKQVAATRETDTGRGVSFTQTLVAKARLIEIDGTVTDFPDLEVEGVLFDQPGLPEVAYQALPALTQRLAEQIHRTVTYRAQTPSAQ